LKCTVTIWPATCDFDPDGGVGLHVADGEDLERDDLELDRGPPTGTAGGGPDFVGREPLSEHPARAPAPPTSASALTSPPPWPPRPTFEPLSTRCDFGRHALEHRFHPLICIE